MKLSEKMKLALGDRLVAEFSRVCDVDPEKISDCLVDKECSLTRFDLLKIVGNADRGVTYKDLAIHFDFSDNDSSFNLLELKMWIEAVKFELENLETNVRLHSSEEEYKFLRDFLEATEHYYPSDRTPDFGVQLKHVFDNSTIVNLSWIVDTKLTASFYFGILYNADKSIDQFIFDSDELFKYGLDVKSIEGLEPYSVVVTSYLKHSEPAIMQPISAEEQLLSSIFGSAPKTRIIEGYGFKLPDKLVMRSFCLSHFNTLKVSYSYSVLSKIQNELTNCSIVRYGYWISRIISLETDIQVYCYGNIILYPTKMPWEMTDSEKFITKNHLYSVLDKYALDLRSTVQKYSCTSPKPVEFEMMDLDEI